MLTKEQRDEILRILPEIPFAPWLQLLCYLESIAAPEEWQMVPTEIIKRFPEINPSNYNHDDVCALNDWGVELVLAAAPKPGDSNE